VALLPPALSLQLFPVPILRILRLLLLVHHVHSDNEEAVLVKHPTRPRQHMEMQAHVGDCYEGSGCVSEVLVPFAVESSGLGSVDDPVDFSSEFGRSASQSCSSSM
jgi:hypothetical protein